DQGFFAKEGLEINVTVTPSSTEQMRGLIKGTFDIATGAFDNVLAWSGKEGPEIIAVAHQTESPTLPLFVRPDIKKWDDLRGKKLAAGATPKRLESMVAGETFAGILGAPVDKDALAAGMIKMADHREVLPDYPGSLFAVTRPWAESHRAELIRFLRARTAG